MTEELKPCPLTWAIQRLNSTPYSLTKDECVDVLRGLRDEIRALTASQPAQAGEVDERVAFEAWKRTMLSGFDAWEAWQARASLPTQPAQAAQVPDIDYQALIQAAWGTHKYAQGTRGCIAFKHGAEWFRGLLTTAQQGATND